MTIGFQIEKLIAWFGYEGAVALVGQAGFDRIDLSLHTPDIGTGLVAQNTEAALYELFRPLKDFAAERALKFEQIHSPMPSFQEGTASYNEFLFQLQCKSIAVCAAVGAPYAVVHLQFPRQAVYDGFREEGRAMNLRFFSRLIPWLVKYDVKIGIENLYATDFEKAVFCPTLASRADDMCDWIDTLNGIAGEERFVACLDIGHAQILGYDLTDMIRTLGSRLRLLHVHDNDGIHDLHSIPYSGTVNWEAVVKGLKEIGYAGCFCLEAEFFVERYGKASAFESLALGARIARELANRINAPIG